MDRLQIFVVAYMLLILLVLRIVLFVQDDGLKKLAAKLVRFVESRKRKKRKGI